MRNFAAQQFEKIWLIISNWVRSNWNGGLERKIVKNAVHIHVLTET